LSARSPNSVRRRFLLPSLALSAALGCVAILAQGAPAARQGVHGYVLTAGTDFGLTGGVTGLSPGLTASLVLTATNPLGETIIVRTVTAAVPAAPPGCPAGDLTLGGVGFGGSPPSATVTGLATAVPAGGSARITIPLLLARGTGNQCQEVTYAFTFVGTATGPGVKRRHRPRFGPYAVVVSSRPNPSVPGQRVAISAALRGGPAARPPAGSIRFYRCTSPAGLPAYSPRFECRRWSRIGPVVWLSGGFEAGVTTRGLPLGASALFAVYKPQPGPPGYSVTSTHIVRCPTGSCRARRRRR